MAGKLDGAFAGTVRRHGKSRGFHGSILRVAPSGSKRWMRRYRVYAAGDAIPRGDRVKRPPSSPPAPRTPTPPPSVAGSSVPSPPTATAHTPAHPPSSHTPRLALSPAKSRVPPVPTRTPRPPATLIRPTRILRRMPRRLHEAAKLPRGTSCFPIEKSSTHTRCRPSSSSRPASDSTTPRLPIWKHPPSMRTMSPASSSILRSRSRRRSSSPARFSAT